MEDEAADDYNINTVEEKHKVPRKKVSNFGSHHHHRLNTVLPDLLLKRSNVGRHQFGVFAVNKINAGSLITEVARKGGSSEDADVVFRRNIIDHRVGMLIIHANTTVYEANCSFFQSGNDAEHRIFVIALDDIDRGDELYISLERDDCIREEGEKEEDEDEYAEEEDDESMRMDEEGAEEEEEQGDNDNDNNDDDESMIMDYEGESDGYNDDDDDEAKKEIHDVGGDNEDEDLTVPIEEEEDRTAAIEEEEEDDDDNDVENEEEKKRAASSQDRRDNNDDAIVISDDDHDDDDDDNAARMDVVEDEREKHLAAAIEYTRGAVQEKGLSEIPKWTDVLDKLLNKTHLNEVEVEMLHKEYCMQFVEACAAMKLPEMSMLKALHNHDETFNETSVEFRNAIKAHFREKRRI